MHQDKDIDKIIFLYLSGEADLEQIQKLREWLGSPGNKDVFEQISSFWNNSRIHIETEENDETFARLINKIKNERAKNEERTIASGKATFPLRWSYFGSVAAAIILILAFVVSLQLVKNDPDEVEPKIAMVQKQNPEGQKSTIKLPDGSTVWLNAGSSISYPERFDLGQRRVSLQGEAFFEVVRDENRPFLVDAGNMNISVLGTKFNVRAFPEDAEVNVSLVSGKVKVDRFSKGSAADSVILEPGQEIQYNIESGDIQKKDFDVEYVTAWKEGTLILKKDSLASFIQKLKRWYGVEVKVMGTPSENFVVTGKFQRENMENVLRALQFSRDFDFTIEGKLLTIKFK